MGSPFRTTTLQMPIVVHSIGSKSSRGGGVLAAYDAILASSETQPCRLFHPLLMGDQGARGDCSESCTGGS